ncbi:MAG: hypothetical protein IJ106_13610 [Parasporobacterium sp.]|nr:hypothetical protein [Parasporobacterium sp.]
MAANIIPPTAFFGSFAPWVGVFLLRAMQQNRGCERHQECIYACTTVDLAADSILHLLQKNLEFENTSLCSQIQIFPCTLHFCYAQEKNKK